MSANLLLQGTFEAAFRRTRQHFELYEPYYNTGTELTQVCVWGVGGLCACVCVCPKVHSVRAFMCARMSDLLSDFLSICHVFLTDCVSAADCVCLRLTVCAHS